jgi:ERCC4-type nuclease
MIVDSREKNDERLEELAKLCKYEVKKIQGDADVLVNKMLIEVTTTEDFHGKLNSNRLNVQVWKMQAAKRQLKEEDNIDITLCWLLEGTKWSYKDKRTRKRVYIPKNRVFSELNRLSVDHGFTIIRTSNAEKTAKYLAKLAKREKSLVTEKIYQSLRNKKGIGKKSLDDQAKFVLEGFIDCGNKTAHDLLVESAQHYSADYTLGSLGRVLDMILNEGVYDYIEDGESTIYKGKLKEKNSKLINHEYQGGK